jgi:hypothetical protein
MVLRLVVERGNVSNARAETGSMSVVWGIKFLRCHVAAAESFVMYKDRSKGF